MTYAPKQLEMLIGGLESPDPAVRLDIVRVLGMLHETRALDVLRQRFGSEPDAGVQQAIGWAGKRLYEADQAGYSTLEALFEYFGVHRAIEAMPDDNEAELLKQMQDNFDADLLRMKEKGVTRRVGTAVAAGLGGAALGGSMLGLGMMGATLTSGMGDGAEIGARPGIGLARVPATMPTQAEIGIWVRRLREASQARTREQAVIELGQLNNPAALPFLAAAFVSDPVANVREAAERFGKVLHWGMIYWTMTQDGSLDAEMRRRAAALGKRVSQAETGAEPPGQARPPSLGAGSASGATAPTPPREDVGEILRKAKQARADRRKKR